MFSRIRRHCNFTTVVAFIALLFAMSGGAYAAQRYLITSTRQISPTVLKALKAGRGSAGANGAPGNPGAQGTAGSQGAQGPKGDPGAGGARGETGETGEQGAEGERGPAGATGATGVKGDPWTPNNTLPKGATETGVWGIRQAPEGKEELLSLSFPIPLANELDEAHVHIAPDPACPGTVEKPTAEPGNLCVYPGVAANIKLEQIVKPYGLNEKGAGTTGANLVIIANTEPPVPLFYSNGTWAVTAE
jgi:Collagen triple helix repeat (20 copies)